MARIEKLTAGTVFAGCTKSEARRLDGLSTLLDFESGAVLTREGRRATHFGVILEGSATVTIDGRTIGRLVVGDHFGEGLMLDRAAGAGRVRSATVTADGPLWAAVCSGQELSSVLSVVPWLTDRLLAASAARIASHAERQGADPRTDHSAPLTAQPG